MSSSFKAKKESLTWASSILELYKGKKIPKSLESLEHAHIKTLRDLLWTLPAKFYPVIINPPLDQCNDGDFVTVSGKLRDLNFKPSFVRKMRLFQIRVKLDTQEDTFPLIWFNAYPNIKQKVQEAYNLQETISFTGAIKRQGIFIQIVNPKIKKLGSENESTLLTYSTINKVKSHFIQNLIKKIPIYLWETIPELENKISLKESFQSIHQYTQKEFKPEHLQRIKYQELIEDQFKILIRKEKKNLKKINPIQIESKLKETALKIFSYELTTDQKTGFDNMIKDFLSGSPMLRLIQGDVGCGKTSLAILGMYLMREKGFQSAFMAPTENLAFQHYKTLQKFFPESDIAYLSSSVKPKVKSLLLEDIQKGNRKIIVGTHSLFQEKVIYHNLSLSIIDEQHKFGVDQRMSLINKSLHPHCILLSATPIPRTLSLTTYGDLEISTIRSMPSNRKGFKTRVVSKSNMNNYLNFLKTRLSLGEQAYIVLPNIETSEVRNTRSIDEVFHEYSQYFPEASMAKLHGQLPADEQKEVIQKFREKDVQVLISTTVIEVGIHVSNATVMTIYYPEFFGLSSLHQLRGRVGRDEKQGFCFLIQSEKTGKSQKEKMSFFESHDDGFDIAQKDLELRGEGDLFGRTQSGSFQAHKISNPILDHKIFSQVIREKDMFFKNTATLKEQTIFMTIQNDPYILNLV